MPAIAIGSLTACPRRTQIQRLWAHSLYAQKLCLFMGKYPPSLDIHYILLFAQGHEPHLRQPLLLLLHGPSSHVDTYDQPLPWPILGRWNSRKRSAAPIRPRHVRPPRPSTLLCRSIRSHQRRLDILRDGFPSTEPPALRCDPGPCCSEFASLLCACSLDELMYRDGGRTGRRRWYCRLGCLHCCLPPSAYRLAQRILAAA